MSDQLYFRQPASRAGMVRVLDAGNSASEGLALSLINLSPGGAEASAAESDETVLVVLSGSCDVVTDAGEWRGLGARRGVFDGPAAAIYLPPSSEFRVRSERGAEVAMLRAPAKSSTAPYVIRPDEVDVAVRGTGSFRREVHTILDGRRPAGALIVGETFNDAGAWSSYPPHKHDLDDLPRQALLQEVYHFRLDPPQGFGIQRVYSPERNVDLAYVVRDGDSVIIPHGYHPVVAAPGYRLYYLWALAGKGRELKMVEDPEHSWVPRI